ncbi:hypothetical protein B9Z55_026969 [Caenorhabditis nigoni]|uniref:F-box domain-containing protein n=1 Tax=Caenorhabditis nigoni TaxID=1611254 RepID=A0A2G5SIA8_9PELO|nr:hypothetical protein B9Z55_026969 [Caenorhabditis nigoni]PIC14781.1 hypothetical protein B9Z55_026969 [Caenorhabditis nigoni]
MPCKIPKSAYSDLATIRKFVLYDVLLEVSPNYGYKRLCEALRKNLNYRKYEYFYYQIYNGNLEPHMPRFFAKSFSDLPMEVLGEIVSNLSAKERLGVRKVCRNLRDVIDQQKPNFKILKMCFDRNQSIILKIDDLDLKFPKDSYEEPLKRLENSLKSSRHVEKLELKLDHSQGSKSLVEMLRDVSSTRLKVGKTKISVENTDEALEILGFFEPGELKKIELEDTIAWRVGKERGNVERLVEMDQFEQAEDVHIREFGIFDAESELLNKFLHLKRMVIKLNVLRKEVALYLKNAILEDSGRRLWYVSSEKELNIHEFEVYLENNGDIPDSDDSLESDDEDPRQRLIRLRNMLEPVCLTEDIPNSEETLTLDIDSTEIIFDRINLNDSIDHSFND